MLSVTAAPFAAATPVSAMSLYGASAWTADLTKLEARLDEGVHGAVGT